MEKREQYQQLCAALAEQEIAFQPEAPLALLTTFRIGGKAAVLCFPKTEQELCRIAQLTAAAGVRLYLLGCGSNTLFADEGFDGVVAVTAGMNQVQISGNTMTAQAGVPLAKLCLAAQRSGLSGLQFAYGIPGSVGGAVYMNAGAYGGEIKDLLVSVRALTKDGCIREYPAAVCEMSYRHSRFTQTEELILSATLQLQEGQADEILTQMQEIFARRKEKQPLEWPSAGSTFKRPQGAYAAALIEQCGLKGLTVGGAQVSEKHSGFVINRGGATCRDVEELTEKVARIVLEKTGFALEKEICVVR